MLESLDLAAETTYPYTYRRTEETTVPYVCDKLSAEENVANTLAERFYNDHNTEVIDRAIEVNPRATRNLVVMNTRYCLRRELGICKKEKNGSNPLAKAREPFYIESGKNRFRLAFDCSNCEMQVIKE